MVRGRESGLEVFAVEDRTVQISWADLGRGEVTIDLEGPRHVVRTSGGPGAITIGGLEPDATYRASVSGGSLPEPCPLDFRTLTPPPGEEVLRFATVSDLHIGMDHFDVRQRIPDLVPADAAQHPRRCTDAAIEELLAWGAERLVVKGDITDGGRGWQWAEAGQVLGDLPVPVHAICGNHDLKHAQGALTPARAEALTGIPLTTEPLAIDLPGLRLVLCPTAITGHSQGWLPDKMRRAAAELAASPRPVFMVLHHYLQRLPVATFWPPGIPEPQGALFLRALGRANPRTFVTSGHTHRHRRRHAGPIVLTEVGSPKDYPGTWAGYVVHEGGIRQVVRRVEDRSCVAWTQKCGDAVYGLWGHWSVGRLEHRCFTHTWPA